MIQSTTSVKRKGDSSHTSDFEIGTLVATMSKSWRCRVSAKIGWAGVNIL